MKVYIGVISGAIYKDSGKENGSYCIEGSYWGFNIGDYIGIMEKKMETTISIWGLYRVIEGLYGVPRVYR